MPRNEKSRHQKEAAHKIDFFMKVQDPVNTTPEHQPSCPPIQAAARIIHNPKPDLKDMFNLEFLSVILFRSGNTFGKGMFDQGISIQPEDVWKE
jgi:hypothetical protein